MKKEFRRRIYAIAARDKLEIKYIKKISKYKLEVMYKNGKHMVYKWVNNAVISGKPV